MEIRLNTTFDKWKDDISSFADDVERKIVSHREEAISAYFVIGEENDKTFESIYISVIYLEQSDAIFYSAISVEPKSPYPLFLLYKDKVTFVREFIQQNEFLINFLNENDPDSYELLDH